MFAFSAIPRHHAADYRYCRDVVRRNAENFPVGSLLAPRSMRPHLFAVYAFARTADDFADTPGRSDEEKIRLLDDWKRRLSQSQAGEADHPIFRALHHTLDSTGLPAQPLHDLLAAFRRDVVQKRYATFTDLLDYCRLSANPVGRIVLHLAGERREEMLMCSDAICTALQLANHWQDLGLDPYNGRPLYLPTEDMRQFGVSERMVLARRFTPALGGLILHHVEVARGNFLAGEPLLGALSGRLRLELTLTWHAGMRLLEKIEDLGGNTLRERPSLDGRDWARCFTATVRRVLS